VKIASKKLAEPSGKLALEVGVEGALRCPRVIRGIRKRVFVTPMIGSAMPSSVTSVATSSVAEPGLSREALFER
jgi:hypothetical protein